MDTNAEVSRWSTTRKRCIVGFPPYRNLLVRSSGRGLVYSDDCKHVCSFKGSKGMTRMQESNRDRQIDRLDDGEFRLNEIEQNNIEGYG